MSGEFDGQTVVITGAGSGVGRAAALRFAHEGADLALCDLHEDRVEDLCDELATIGAEPLAMACDVRTEADIAGIAAATMDRFGRIDVVCNNAGVPGPKRPVPTWELSDEEWNRLFETNLRSTLYMVRHTVPALIATGGRIVNTASVAGIVVWGTVAYGASKAALIQLTRGLAVELAPHGVRVNCVCPGMIATRFGEGLERPAAASAGLSAIPLGRVATAEEIAEAILYLASARSSYATGASLVLDGGYSIA